jgi:hypothetical protein
LEPAPWWSFCSSCSSFILCGASNSSRLAARYLSSVPKSWVPSKRVVEGTREDWPGGAREWDKPWDARGL